MDDSSAASSNDIQSASSTVESPPCALSPLTPLTDGDCISTGANSVHNHEVPLIDYLALGCLRSQHTVSLETMGWEDMVDASLFTDYLPGHLKLTIERLLNARWIRVFASAPRGRIVFRIFVLPDDVAQSTVDRTSRSLRTELSKLAQEVDISREGWEGHPDPLTAKKFDIWATPINRSLFWLFNKLPSPSPRADAMEDRYSRLAVEGLLSDDPLVPGLQAKLFPYQARSVAAMIQREASPAYTLDPRFERRNSPTGHTFYYNPRDALYRQQPPQYESNRGGILAETMGVGKTVMCIALILATKHHLPRIPPQYVRGPPRRNTTGSLAQMAAAAAGRSAVPIKFHFEYFYSNAGLDLSRFIAAVDDQRPSYEIPYTPRRSVRKSSALPPPRRLRMCSATIVVVPRNLLHQWKAELHKHVSSDGIGLRTLTLETSRDRLPSTDKLMTYDIILFSKGRFESEHKDGLDDQGRSSTNVRAECRCPYIGSTRERDCSCLKPEDIYSSPLKQLHFLRIIIDEGHEFSSSASNAVRVATEIVTAERRWVVSGTPAKDRLFGVDVEIQAKTETDALTPPEELWSDGSANSMQEAPISAMDEAFAHALERRKRFKKDEEVNGASKSLGILATNFLKVRPWAGTEDQLKVEWEDFVFRHEISRGRTYAAFSPCMVSMLEALVIKTRPEDVDVVLPPLEHKIVYLKPSFYDILTINLFILFITANAVLCERTDIDYLFHKNSAGARRTLIKNLRNSAFFWTGFSKADILSAVGHSQRYLEKEGTNATIEDRDMLKCCLQFAEVVLASHSWHGMSQTNELGLFVNSWPGGKAKPWALNGDEVPSMIGATQLLSAQRFVNDQLFDEEPTLGLEEKGVTQMTEVFQSDEHDIKHKSTKEETKVGVPSSGLRTGEHTGGRHILSPKKPKPKRVAPRGSRPNPSNSEEKAGDKELPASPVKRKRTRSFNQRDLPLDSPVAAPAIVGTVSSKVSYLLSKVMALQAEEKILIFYDTEDSAYYIAQCLELMHIKHLIYAKTLNSEQRSKYIVTFDMDDSIRVLLMDINQGALGLNVNKASRVFFVNPPCKPHAEAQAIKRAHRIGQARPVHVETLILQGTVEEAIFNRSRAMTREEHAQASKEISDDQGVTQIIQAAKSLPISSEDGLGWLQMAPLETPLQIFGRKGRGDVKIKGIDREKEESAKAGPQEKRQRKAKMKSSRLEGFSEGHIVINVATEAPTSLMPTSVGVSVVPSIFG